MDEPVNENEAYPNSYWYWRCMDCGHTFGREVFGLIPLPREEQEQRPLCLRCYRYRLERGLAVLSEQAPPRPGEDPWL